eukprot:367113-Hanusia_phi.AAC.1
MEKEEEERRRRKRRDLYAADRPMHEIGMFHPAVVLGSLDVITHESFNKSSLLGSWIYLSSMSVREEFRRHGVGHALLEDAENLAAEDEAVRSIYLHVQRRSTTEKANDEDDGDDDNVGDGGGGGDDDDGGETNMKVENLCRQTTLMLSVSIAKL